MVWPRLGGFGSLRERRGSERFLIHAFDRFGGDLLSHVLGRSTIGAAALNGRVRDGIGCFARANATKPVERMGTGAPPGRAGDMAVHGGGPGLRTVTSVFPRFRVHDFVRGRGSGEPVFFRIGIKPVGRLVLVN